MMGQMTDKSEGNKKDKEKGPKGLSDEAWRLRLDPMSYRVLREKGTERAFTGEHLHNDRDGSYVCAGCGNRLFPSGTKFDSGSGWPSFWAPIDKDGVVERPDHGLIMRRIEVLCARCGGHLGHVFKDGPEPTGMRYCINSAALRFEESEEGKDD